MKAVDYFLNSKTSLSIPENWKVYKTGPESGKTQTKDDKYKYIILVDQMIENPNSNIML
jgi:hypothetical protein